MTDHAIREAAIASASSATFDQRDQAWPIVNRLMGSLVDSPPPDDFEERLERVSLFGAALHCVCQAEPVDDAEVRRIARAVRASYRADGLTR